MRTHLMDFLRQWYSNPKPLNRLNRQYSASEILFYAEVHKAVQTVWRLKRAKE